MGQDLGVGYISKVPSLGGLPRGCLNKGPLGPYMEPPPLPLNTCHPDTLFIGYLYTPRESPGILLPTTLWESPLGEPPEGLPA